MHGLRSKFSSDDSGQDLVEHALMVGVIAVVAVSAVVLVGTKVLGYFVKLNTTLP